MWGGPKYTTQIDTLNKIMKKSHKQETLNLSTNVDSSTDTKTDKNGLKANLYF